MNNSSDPNPYDAVQPLSMEKPPTERGNLLWYCLGSCLFMLVIGVVGLGILSYVVYTNSKAIATNFARQAMVKAIEGSDLSEADKREVVAQIDRVAEDYKAGRITTEQVGEIAQELGESPLLMVGMAYMIEQKYINSSGLTPTEKAEAHLTLHRAARGAFEESITPEELNEVAAPLTIKGPDGEDQLKDTVTDAELRTFLADLKQLVDDRQIPEEEFEVKIGEEFRKAVDRVYNQ